MRRHIKIKTIWVVILFININFAQGPGTLLYDHFGVTLALQSPHSGGTNYSFDWNSLVPTLNTGTANYVESDWYGNWNFTQFGSDANTIQHTPTPGTPDFDYHPSGDEPYDVEALYFDDDATNLYVVIVTSVPHYIEANNDVGIVDPRISATAALVRPGDLSINTFDGPPRIERNTTEWNYNFGVDLTHENRDVQVSVGGYNTRSMRDMNVGNEFYSTRWDAGGSNILNPTDSDWYTSLVDGVVEASWEHTNFDPQSTMQTPFLSYIGNVVTNYYEYDFGGGLEENGYPTYVYEFTIPRYLFGNYDPCAGDPIGIQWVEGCRNDGNGTTEAVSITATADVCNYASIGDYVWKDINEDGTQDGGEPGLENVLVYLYTQTATEVANTTTNSSGYYNFTDIEPGNYFVKFIPPVDYLISPQDQGGGDTQDSDANISTGQTIVTTLDPGENDFTWDTGMYYDGSCPGNLLLNPGFESGTGTAFNATDNWTNYETDQTNNARNTTNPNSGTYRAIISTNSEPYQQTSHSIVLGDVYTLNLMYAGAAYWDLGVDQINVRLYYIDGVTPVNLFADTLTPLQDFGTGYDLYSNSFSAVTDAAAVGKDLYIRFEASATNGEYASIDNLCLTVESPTLGTIGDYVWNDEDADGVQDAGEPGMDNVTVELYLDNNNDGIIDGGDTHIGQATTSGGGLYDFTGLSAGDYLVTVSDDNNILTNYSLTGGTDPHDVTLSAGQDYNDADFGYYDYDPTGYIYDEATGEIVSGGLIEVTGPGVVTIVHDGSSGYYEFYTDGTAGTYTIALTVPPGYLISTDCLPSGTFDPTGGPNPTVLGSGEAGSTGYLEDYTCGNNTFYYTFDLAPADPEIQHNNFPLKFINTARIGDYVWLDSDLDGTQNDGGATAGIDNVKLTLFDGTGTSVGETYTDADGWYEFIDLPADNYTIIVDDLTLPSEIDIQTYDYDGLGSQDAAQFTLAIGESNLQIDFGYGIIPLPVTLSGFDVQIEGKQVKLTWATQSEVENQGFFVNRKLIDENEWEELSNFLENPGLRGQGSTTRKTEYEFIDSTALSGFTYEYRLGDIDYNTAKYYHNNRIVRIEVVYTAIPDNYSLQPAYPNPFNPYTTITYSLPRVDHVRLNVYDIKGNLVRKLVNGIENPGIKNVSWDSKNEFGEDVPSGMYIYTFQAANFKRSKKILLIR